MSVAGSGHSRRCDMVADLVLAHGIAGMPSRNHRGGLGFNSAMIPLGALRRLSPVVSRRSSPHARG